MKSYIMGVILWCSLFLFLVVVLNDHINSNNFLIPGLIIGILGGLFMGIKTHDAFD